MDKLELFNKELSKKIKENKSFYEKATKELHEKNAFRKFNFIVRQYLKINFSLQHSTKPRLSQSMDSIEPNSTELFMQINVMKFDKGYNNKINKKYIEQDVKAEGSAFFCGIILK